MDEKGKAKRSGLRQQVFALTERVGSHDGKLTMLTIIMGLVFAGILNLTFQGYQTRGHMEQLNRETREQMEQLNRETRARMEELNLETITLMNELAIDVAKLTAQVEGLAAQMQGMADTLSTMAPTVPETITGQAIQP